MAVRKLVGQLESRRRSMTADEQRTSRRNSDPGVFSRSVLMCLSHGDSVVPPPNKPRAKFLKHPLLGDQHDIDSIDGLPLLASPSFTNDDDSTTISDDPSATISDIAVTVTGDDGFPLNRTVGGDEQSAPAEYTAESLGIRKRTPANSRNPSEAEAHELVSLLPTATYTSGILTTSEGSTYAASQHASLHKDSTGPATGPTPIATPASHIPIPATTIFARDAAPLYLPHLDDYLATLPAPSFPNFPSKDKKKGVPMFPPMDHLAATGKSLEDLEDNSQVAPWWRNRTSIFGTLTGWALGLTVSCGLRV